MTSWYSLAMTEATEKAEVACPDANDRKLSFMLKLGPRKSPAGPKSGRARCDASLTISVRVLAMTKLSVESNAVSRARSSSANLP